MEELFFRYVWPLYRNAQSPVRALGSCSDNFLVHVVLPAGSLLSPLLFIAVEALSLELIIAP